MSSLVHEILVCYDIADDKRRTRFFQDLRDLGLTSLQKSVFWGRVRVAEERALQHLIRNSLNRETDKAFFMRVALADVIRHTGFGYDDPSLFENKSFDTL